MMIPQKLAFALAISVPLLTPAAVMIKANNTAIIASLVGLVRLGCYAGLVREWEPVFPGREHGRPAHRRTPHLDANRGE